MMQNSIYKTLLILFILGLFLASFGIADQVILTNGDRFSGKIIKSDGKTLSLKSDLTGDIIVPWEAVVEITSADPLYFTLKDGKVIMGTVTTIGGQFEVATQDTGKVIVAKDSIDAVRSAGEQAIVERLKHPGFFELWAGAFDFGLALAQGNSETTNVSFALNTDRTTTHDKTSFFAAALYATNSASGESVTTANIIRGGGRYEYNVSPRLFLYGFGSLDHDELQELDLRLLLGGGLGWHVVKTDPTVFDVFAGSNWNREYYSDDVNLSSAELQFGEELSHKLSDRLLFTERFVYFLNLTDSGEYRLAFDTSAVASMNKWLGWQLTFSDRFNSNPQPGIKENDLILTAGLRISFAN